MSTEIRALTIRQPWAWAIAVAGKTVENRTWPTRYRGLLAIHAGKGMDDPYDLPGGGKNTVRFLRQTDAGAPATALGAVIAVATLADCHDGATEQGECSDWADRWQWHWVLADVHRLARPVPCPGRLGLWRLPPEIETAVRNQIGAT